MKLQGPQFLWIAIVLAVGCREKDSAGAGDFDVVGVGPTVIIEAPTSGSLLDPRTDVLLRANLSDDRTAAADLWVRVQSSIDGDLVTDAHPDEDGNFAAVLRLSSGSHRLVVLGRDEDGQVSSDAVEVELNGRPEAPEVRINPELPEEAESLRAEIVAESVDPDSDLVSYSYAWSLTDVGAEESEEIDTLAPDQVASGITLRGQVWTVVVTPSDAYGEGDPGQASVMVANVLPTIDAVRITPDPARTADGLSLIVEGWFDADGDEETSEIEWSINGEVVAGEVSTTLLASYTEREDEVVATVTPVDPYGSGDPVASAQVVIQNTPPEADIAFLLPTAPSTLDDLTVTVAGWGDDDGDPERYRYRWFIDGVEDTTVTDAVLEAPFTAATNEIYVEVIPVDDFDEGLALRTDSVIVENAIPTISSVVLTPSSPTTTDAIVAVVSGWSDLDGDPERYRYRWFIDGIETASPVDGELPASLTEKGNVISVEVTPFDDLVDGTPMTSASVTVLNTLPTIERVALDPSAPYTNDDLRAVVSGWMDSDGEPETLLYEWTIDGGVVAGLTDSSMPSSLTVRGNRIAVTVTPSDAEGDGVPMTSDIVTVLNSAPTITSVAIDPGEPLTTDTLTCSWTGFDDPDGDADDSRVAWSVGGVHVATGTVLDSSAFTGGDAVQCTVSAHDGTDVGTVLVASVLIENTLPAIDSVSISPVPALATDTLNCSWSGFSDPDGDPDRSTIGWTVNGIFAGTSATLSGSFVHGDLVSCTVTPFDGHSEGSPVTAALIISNTVPLVGAVSIDPGVASVDDDLTCRWSGFSDPDGEADVSTVAWTVDGASAGTGEMLSSGAAGGSVVVWTVTPYDGTDAGIPVSSPPLVIDNTAPTLRGASLTPNPATVADTLTCTPGEVSDVDGTTTFTFSYTWYVEDALVTSAVSSTLGSAFFVRGQSVYCRVSASDGAAWSVAVISNIVAIENTPPEVTDLVVAPDVIYTDDTVTATVATRDLDGDPVSVEYHWVVNGSVVTAGVSGATLDGLVAFDKHATVQVGVSPNDGFDEGITAVSDPLVVRNTPPEAPSVEVLPTLPEPEDDLVCTIVVESFDLDDDAITYSYAWYVDGFSTPYSGSTLPASATAHGERWECDVTPFDGDDVGPVVVDSVVVNDLTEPDPPQFDEAVGHTNDTEHTLSGDCEAGCAVVMYCDDSSGTDTYAATCDSVDRFSVDVSLTAADTTECYATCTDGAGNTSGDSDVLTIEVCSPIDVYEDDDTYGDLSSDAIDEWGDVADDGSTTVTIRANVLDEDDDDWYAITATDELAEDLAAGSDAFDFQIEMTAGSDEYRFLVHKGSGSLGDLECPDEDGYTEYNWYNADVGDGDHGIPSDPQACGGSGSAAYNECQDDGDVFYIRVFRRPSVPDSCGHYELDISNGG